jgi:hypothetical protein
MHMNVSLLGVLSGVFACQSMSPVKEPLRPGGGTVEVRIDPARRLDVQNADGSRTSLEAVSRVWGEPIEIHGDSVRFRIESWRGGSPAADRTEYAAKTVLPMSDPQVGFFQDHFSWKKNLFAVALTVGLVALAIGQASVAYRYPTPDPSQAAPPRTG